MANRRKKNPTPAEPKPPALVARQPQPKQRPPAREPREPAQKKRVPHEVVAVVLGCLGVLTIASLLSFHPGDASLNASGSIQVQNWIGPAGAYWADALFQLLGVSSYAIGIGCLLASWRALVGKQVWPGLREAAGLSATVVSIGAFAHLVLWGEVRAYPAGGVVGAIAGVALREQLAVAGSFIVASALVLVSLAITADGVLAGLGWRGLVVVRGAASRLVAAGVLVHERQRRLRERRAELEAAANDALPKSDVSDWSMGELPTEAPAEPPAAPPVQLADRRLARERHEARVAEARERAAAMVEKELAKELDEKRARAERLRPEPELRLDDMVDVASEDGFSVGKLPSPPSAPVEEELPELDDADVEIDVPVLAAVRPPPPPEPTPVEVPAQPAFEAPKRAAPKKKGPSEPQIVDVRPDLDVEAAIQKAEGAVADDTEKVVQKRSFELPPVSLLEFEAQARAPVDPQKLRDNAVRLTKTLKDYGIEGHVREIRPGPVVTMYEYVPAPGIKLSKIASLADDLAMSMEALRVRIVAPIPGKGAVGIEIPNEVRETVYLKEIVAHDAFKKQKHMLSMALGKDLEGNAYVSDLAKMPHLLVAGATGAGKSVSINTMIMSILFRATPEEVRMIMVDPKMLELSVYDGIPHLLLPVVTDPKKAALALRWATEEMERRYSILSETGVRGIDAYNKKLSAARERGEEMVLPPKKEGEEPRKLEPMPYLVVIVDELADLMMVASRDVEGSIMRLAQMARAAGIHLILATQRPSVDVITGVIKANFPTRIAFQVASKHDSRTIIDANGAEHLLGRGDMLFLSPGAGGISRVHGAYVSDEEIHRTVSFWKDQGTPQYDESILVARPDMEGEEGAGEAGGELHDEMYDQAVAIVAETRQASISMIQRRLRIGYNRAARMVERMEVEGIVGPADGAKPREVLVSQIAP